MNDSQWAKWALEVREKAPTLCGVDLVRITPELSSELLEKIRSEGTLIYEKKDEGKSNP